MDLCLLTSFHSNHSRSSFIHRLAEESQKRGVTLHLINPSQVGLTFADGKSEVRYHGRPLPKYDLTHYALRWDDDHTWSVVEELRNQGYLTVPTQRMPLGDTITMARLFAKQNIKIPRTWVLPNAAQVPMILQDLTFPCVFRVRRGQKGRNVHKVGHAGEALRLAEQLGRAALPLVVQEILEPIGQDVRAVVVGNRILTAIERHAVADHVRPAEIGNQRVAVTQLTDVERALVQAAVRIYHAPYAAVNFLRTEKGPVLLEVSRAPALAEAEAASGLNLAAEIIGHLLSLVK